MIGRYAVEHVGIFKLYEEKLAARRGARPAPPSGSPGEEPVQVGAPCVKEAVRKYLQDASYFGCSKSRILLPLNNIVTFRGA